MSLAQGNNTPTRPRIEPGSPDPESEALTTRPVRPLFKVLPMVPLVIPLVPMVMPMVPLTLQMVPLVPLVSQRYHWLPMAPLVKLPMVPLGEPRTEPISITLSSDVRSKQVRALTGAHCTGSLLYTFRIKYVPVKRALCLMCEKESFSRKGTLFAKRTDYNTKRSCCFLFGEKEFVFCPAMLLWSETPEVTFSSSISSKVRVEICFRLLVTCVKLRCPIKAAKSTQVSQDKSMYMLQ